MRTQPHLWASPRESTEGVFLLEFDHGSRRTKLLIHVMQLSIAQAITRWVNMEMTTMTLKVQYLTKLEEGTQIPAGWYVTTPFCPGVVFATEQEALTYGRTEELRQELIARVRAMSLDELRALKVKMT